MHCRLIRNAESNELSTCSRFIIRLCFSRHITTTTHSRETLVWFFCYYWFHKTWSLFMIKCFNSFRHAYQSKNSINTMQLYLFRLHTSAPSPTMKTWNYSNFCMAHARPVHVHVHVSLCQQFCAAFLRIFLYDKVLTIW